MTDHSRIRIKHLYISAGHNYFGHHGRPASTYCIEEREEIRCFAGLGIEGDRFFDYKTHYKGQITFFSEEVYEELCKSLNIFTKDLSVFRRNVITSGIDLNELIGTEFEIQGVRFAGTEESRPCYWMDEAFGPGAEQALRGRGGLRARILTDGVLRVDR